MFIKLGEAIAINPENLHPLEKLASNEDLDIENRMYKFAQELKVIAPQAKDFLYFTCVMMHAAEAACLNDDGTKKKTASGEDVVAEWLPVGTESFKWACNDPNIQPYRNQNRDIFPRFELKKAYKQWVGKPLCLDHKSNSVDYIRGVIVDTVYDDKRDRVIALCALDKKNYPDLADKVKTGVSTDVSMGTAVGRAVCTECYAVARTERDFCQHMRGRSCYGEINLELSPIELSLVVAGADQKAKVKHIIASDIAKAAGLLTDYLQLKEASKDISTQDLESIKKDLEKLSSKVNTLMSSSSTDIDQVKSEPEISEILNTKASQNNLVEDFPSFTSELQRAILGARTKLASLQENLNRIYKNEELNMAKKNAYFQGTEEPKVKQQQYEVDPLNDQARQLDKTLVGQPPFPNVGDVEGLYPGDAEKKKALLRLADENERALFRATALKKAKEQLMSKGYFQGTEEPSEKKPQYKPDPLEGKDRMLDKQMVGAPPFPQVGDVEGLYGDDLKTKEKLSRASLKAKFEKAAQPDGRVDKANSRWVVYANDTPVLSATVDQITKKNADALYEAVATKKFGLSLLNRIQTEGFHATASALLKNAQPAPLPEMPAVETPVDPAPVAPVAPAAPAAPAAPVAEELTPPEDVSGGLGEPSEIVDNISDLVQEIEDNIDQLKQIQGPVTEDAEKLNTVMPAGDEEFLPAEEVAALPKTSAQLQSMRKRVNAMLQNGLDDTIVSLEKHAHELKVARKIYSDSYKSMNTQQRNYLNELTISAVKDAKAIIVDASKLKTAVVKYAYGTSELEKRAAATASLTKTATSLEDASVEELKEALETKLQEAAEALELDVEDVELDEDDDDCDLAEFNAVEDELTDEEVLESKEEDEADANMPAQYDPDTGSVTIETKGELMSNLRTKEARAQARMKLAQKGLGFNELSDAAHPGGSADLKLDVKTQVPAKVLVLKDLKKEMLDVATMPPKVRKQAEMIQTLVSEGKLDPTKVDELVSHGVDADAVKYWKSLWAEAKDPKANEFANKLTEEHTKAKKAEEMDNFKGQVKRAYDMANQMAVKGFITEAQVASQVEDILTWNDAGFESFKRMLAKQPVVKQASVPVVGLVDSSAIMLPAAQSVTQKEDLKSIFDYHFEQNDRKKGVKF